MADFSVVKKKDAPRPTRQSGRLALRMREYDKYVESLKAEDAGRLIPAKGESARGVALRISRAGKRVGRPVDTWVSDGTVYFSLV